MYMYDICISYPLFIPAVTQAFFELSASFLFYYYLGPILPADPRLHDPKNHRRDRFYAFFTKTIVLLIFFLVVISDSFPPLNRALFSKMLEAQSAAKVLVMMGGLNFFSNGINLNTIEANPDLGVAKHARLLARFCTLFVCSLLCFFINVPIHQDQREGRTLFSVTLFRSFWIAEFLFVCRLHVCLFCQAQ